MPSNFENDKSLPETHSLARVDAKTLAKRKTGDKKTKVQAESALTNFVRQVDTEINDFTQDATGAIQGFVKHKASEVVDAIAQAPDLFYSEVEQGLRSLEVDRNNFRGTGDSLKQRLFADFGITAKAP